MVKNVSSSTRWTSGHDVRSWAGSGRNERLLSTVRSTRSIAARLGRSPSTVCRELRRNGGARGYRAVAADKSAWERARRPKACKLATHPPLQRKVARLRLLNWSPEQIAGWLRRHYPEDEADWVSHETIYRSVFVQARGVLKKTLVEHLRTHRPIRRSKHATAKGDTRGEIPDMMSIRERPASVEDRAVPGHWEGDLLTGSNNSPKRPFKADTSGVESSDARTIGVQRRADPGEVRHVEHLQSRN
jgi:IS30 family transposase